MPEIRVGTDTFERLQKHAKPFVDTPDTVINLALDALEKAARGPTGVVPAPLPAERQIDPRNLPNLTHTKVLEASLSGTSIVRPNWNSLLDATLRFAMKRSSNFEDLRRYCQVNMKKGRKEDEGYGYLPDIDVSVQGQDANGACRAMVLAARALAFSLDIGFMWRLKEAAAFPGQRGRLRIAPTAAHG
jgi:hypothetical protein